MSSPSGRPPSNIVDIRDVPRGALRRHAWLPASLKSAISTPMVPGYGRDDSDAGGGINLVAGVWTPPERPSAEDLAAARLWMQVYDAERAVVSPEALRKWLVTFVGNLVVGSGTAESDLDMRVKLLSAAVDEREAKHFTKESLKLAWDRFKFVPTANELMKFFDELESDERTQAQRLMAVLDAGSKPPPPKAPAMDVDESIRRHRERQDRERQELAAIVKQRFPQLSQWDRLPGETDLMFIDRIGEQRRKMQDGITRQMRRGAAKPKPVPSPEAMKAAYDATGIKPKDVSESQPAEAGPGP